KKPAASRSREISLRRTVLNDSAKPIAGASVLVVRSARSQHGQILSTEIIARTTSAAYGSFRIQLMSEAERALGDAGIESRSQQLVATASGFGLAWQHVAPDSDGKPLTLQLVPDSTPLEGRVFNLEGEPVAGARIRVMEIL